MLAGGLRTAGQLTLGKDVSMNLDGQVSVGYTDSWGNQNISEHDITAGGTATLSGSFYSPSFLNFQVTPYYNQSRANSNSQAISDSSGVQANVNLFSGSSFPGSVSYSKSYNSLGTFGIPGIPNYTAEGDTQGLGVGWGAYVANLPSLTVSYAQGTDSYSIYGSDANGNSTFHNFNLNSSYKIAGFQLHAGYVYSQTHGNYPLLLSTQENEVTDTNVNSFSLGATHFLPLHGSFSANFNHSDLNTNFFDSTISKYSASVNTVTSAVSLHPTDVWMLGATFNYTDNLLGTLYQSIVGGGGLLPVNTPGQSSESFDTSGMVSYTLHKHWIFSGTVDHRQQSYFGNSYGSNSLTGSVSYWKRALGGTLSTTVSLIHTNVDTSSLSTTGLLGLVTYSRRVGLWDVSGNANYSQNTQTQLIGYTSSGWGYGLQAGRTFGRIHWNANAGGSQSLLNKTGYGFNSQNYGTGITFKWIGISGSYAKSDGTGLLAQNGVVQPPITNPAPLPIDLIMYGGHGYSGGLGINPTKRLTITASYSRAVSDTTSNGTDSHNLSESAVARAQYQFRQLWFNAGYTRFIQGFSASSTLPARLNSFYFGVQRWFNFF